MQAEPAPTTGQLAPITNQPITKGELHGQEPLSYQTIMIFDECAFGGNSTVFTYGGYTSDLIKNKTGTDDVKIASLTIGSFTRLIIYEYDNFKGKHKQFTNTDFVTRSVDCDDIKQNIGSFQVLPLNEGFSNIQNKKRRNHTKQCKYTRCLIIFILLILLVLILFNFI